MNPYIIFEQQNEVPAGRTLYTFLTPIEEAKLESLGHKVISCRKFIPGARDRALTTYKNLLSNIGTYPGIKGKSLSQILQNGNSSSWWYLKPSEKDNETDNSFEMLVKIEIIREISNKHENIAIHRAPDYIHKMFATDAKFEFTETRSRTNTTISLIKRVLGRLRMIKVILQQKRFVASIPKVNLPTEGHAFMGFWKWSFINHENSKIGDKYFKELPSMYKDSSYWLTWFDLERRVDFCRSKDKKVIFLQTYLRYIDILTALASFKTTFLILRHRRSIQKLCELDRVNYSAIVLPKILESSCSYIEGFHQLVEIATTRASKRLQPKVAFSFLEYFLFARAFMTGIRNGNKSTKVIATQHASYSPYKTFSQFTREEFDHGLPAPDLLFCMGEIGKNTFSVGNSPCPIEVHGSPRYSKPLNLPPRPPRESHRLQVLIATSIATDQERHLIELCHLINKRTPTKFQFRLRCHPFHPIENIDWFQEPKNSIEISDDTPLEDDLAWSDMVLVTYSTVGEEALINDLAVGKMLSYSQGSALDDPNLKVPAFYDLPSLEKVLIKSKKLPSRLTEHQLFHKLDNNASNRIYDRIESITQESRI